MARARSDVALFDPDALQPCEDSRPHVAAGPTSARRDRHLQYLKPLKRKFKKARTEIHLRGAVLAGEMHRCRPLSCFKYSKTRRFKLCRATGKTAGKGWTLRLGPRIATKLDARCRPHRVLLQARANHHVNKHNVDEMLLTKSNNDVTSIDDVKGNSAYVCAYASKPDSPDTERYNKILTQTLLTLPDDAPLCDLFRRSLQASTGACIVSSQQATWFLRGRPIVSSPRNTIRLNPLPTERLYTYVPPRRRPHQAPTDQGDEDAEPANDIEGV